MPQCLSRNRLPGLPQLRVPCPSPRITAQHTAHRRDCGPEWSPSPGSHECHTLVDSRCSRALVRDTLCALRSLTTLATLHAATVRRTTRLASSEVTGPWAMGHPTHTDSHPDTHRARSPDTIPIPTISSHTALQFYLPPAVHSPSFTPLSITSSSSNSQLDLLVPATAKTDRCAAPNVAHAPCRTLHLLCRSPAQPAARLPSQKRHTTEFTTPVRGDIHARAPSRLTHVRPRPTTGGGLS